MIKDALVLNEKDFFKILIKKFKPKTNNFMDILFELVKKTIKVLNLSITNYIEDSKVLDSNII
jgi:hypothetical protein